MRPPPPQPRQRSLLGGNCSSCLKFTQSGPPSGNTRDESRVAPRQMTRGGLGPGALVELFRQIAILGGVGMNRLQERVASPDPGRGIGSVHCREETELSGTQCGEVVGAAGKVAIPGIATHGRSDRPVTIDLV